LRQVEARAQFNPSASAHAAGPFQSFRVMGFEKRRVAEMRYPGLVAVKIVSG